GGERQGCQHAARAGSGSADRTEPAESKPNSSTVTAGTAKPAAELILGFTAIAIGSILKGRGFNPRPPSNHRFPLCPPCPLWLNSLRDAFGRHHHLQRRSQHRPHAAKRCGPCPRGRWGDHRG